MLVSKTCYHRTIISPIIKNKNIIRFYPGPLPKILTRFGVNNFIISRRTLNIWNASSKKLYSDSFITPSTLPILIYDPSKIISQLNNAILLKYLPKFNEKNLYVPFIIETFPTNGVSGSFTLPLDQRNLLDSLDTPLLNQHTYLFIRYITTIYGGAEIKSVQDLLLRIEQLFTDDKTVFQYALDNHPHGIKNLFPILQHWLSFDMLNISIPRNSVVYPANYKVPFDSITMAKHLEILTLIKAHLHTESKTEEVLIVNEQDSIHRAILDTNHSLITSITKQPNVDGLVFSTIGINQKVLYPIEAKMISYPENSLKLLASHYTISPRLIPQEYANRLLGQILNQIKNLDINSPEHMFFLAHYTKLKSISELQKKEKISYYIFKEKLYLWLKEFHSSQLREGYFICKNMSFLPSIIAEPYDIDINHNHFIFLLQSDPDLYKRMFNDAKETIRFTDHFPQLSDYRTYDIYKTQLAIMSFLQKYNMVDNYYKIRELLLIEDVH